MMTSLVVSLIVRKAKNFLVVKWEGLGSSFKDGFFLGSMFDNGD